MSVSTDTTKLHGRLVEGADLRAVNARLDLRCLSVLVVRLVAVGGLDTRDVFSHTPFTERPLPVSL